MTTSPSAATQPEPATPSPHAVPSTLHHAGRRRLHLRVARDPGPRRRDLRLGTCDARERIEPAQRVQQRAGRRQDRVEPLEDRRALHFDADPVRAALDRERAEDPHHAEADAGDQYRPQEPVDRAEARQQPQAAPDGPAERLEQPGEQAAGEQRAAQAERRRPRRARALVEHERPDPRADPRAERQPGEGQHAGDEALGPSEQRQQHDQPDDDPVQAGHGRRAYRAP